MLQANKVLSIPNFCDDIIDAYLLCTLARPHGLDLSNATDLSDLQNAIAALQLGFGLGNVVNQRAWMNSQLVDHLRTSTNPAFDTPFNYRLKIQHQAVVHSLDQSVSTAGIDYSLHRPLLVTL